MINLVTLKVIGSIPVSGRNPDAILYDPASGHILTMNGHSDTVSVIDPVAGREMVTINLPGRPEFAVSDGHGQVFVNLANRNQLARLDSRKDELRAVWNLAPCDAPGDLACDGVNQRLLSVCDNRRLMIVTDASDGHQVTRVRIGKGPDAAILDPQMRLACSSNRDGTLTLVHEDDANHYRCWPMSPPGRAHAPWRWIRLPTGSGW